MLKFAAKKSIKTQSMKKLFLSLLTFCALSASAQNEIVVGDMDDSGDLTIGDVTALTDAVLHPEKVRTISTKCDPNVSDPAAIAGQWRTVEGSELYLTADSGATFSADATVKSFEYYPYGRILVLLNAGGYAVKYVTVVRLSADYLVLGQPDGSCTAYYPGDHFANGFVVSTTSLTLKTGESQQLSIVASPEGSISPVFTWTSSNSAVATVDQNGFVTAVKSGTATITATAQNGGSVSVKCSVNVVQMVESIMLSARSLKLDVDETAKLTATVLPNDANDRTFTWSSSNNAVAKVGTNGVVTARGSGVCTITATANDGSGVKAECAVTVVAPKPETVTYTVRGVTFNMKLVKHGSFDMGSDASGAYADEQPVHRVTISNDFYIGETEVTQALWRAVTGSIPMAGSSWISTIGLGNNYPAYYISWSDCQNFIEDLNDLTGLNFRMPTEAEWEYAAKGGNKSQGYTYSGSNTADDVAWYTGNSDGKTHPVATKEPNELGVYDMSGNVYEWCQDWYGNYSSGAQTDPTGPSSGTYRVFRGGCWTHGAGNCRPSSRSRTSPSSAFNYLGLRLVL